MNYEELLESRNGVAMAKEVMPFGMLYKKMEGNKYVNVIDLRNDLIDSLVFCDAISSECEKNKELNHKNQLHFTLETDSAGLYGVKVEQGSFRTFEHLLDESPAIVANKNFISNTIKDLFDITSYLHDKGIFHICYSPSNVLARKGDNSVFLLFHGSAYQALKDQENLYSESVSFIAPEVLEEGVFDARSDIYSIGKFIEYLYMQSEIPFELKSVIKKATAVDPNKRYQTTEEMQKDITKRRNARNTITSTLVALAIAVAVFGLYFTLVPERDDIEYVSPASESASNNSSHEDDGESLDAGYDSDFEMGIEPDTLTDKVDDRKMKEYNAKAEQIFRKRFSREAERILSNIYSSDRMNSTEKNFTATSQNTMEELVRAQQKMGGEAGIPNTRSQVIASEIIDQVTNRLKAEMRAKEAKKDEEQP